MPSLLPAPQRRLLSTIALLVLSLTLYSSYAGLSSNPVPSPSSAVASLSGDALPPSAWAEQLDDRGYFAQKGNVFNQWCVPPARARAMEREAGRAPVHARAGVQPCLEPCLREVSS